MTSGSEGRDFGGRRSFSDLLSAGTGTYSLIAVLTGLTMLFVADRLATHHPGWNEIGVDILRELALVLVSVFGVSFLYEKLSARAHFRKFKEALEHAVERGETNAAVCESLGILEIHRSREAFLSRHPFTKEMGALRAGDRVRVTGRSLVHVLNNWGQFQEALRAGAVIELCMCDPEAHFPNLERISRYLAEDSKAAYGHFERLFRPWLEQAKVSGRVELRFHRVDLTDTLVEVHCGNVHRAAFDMNFGEGVERRFVLYLDAARPIGAMLCGQRYEAIWQLADRVYPQPRTGDGTLSTAHDSARQSRDEVIPHPPHS